MRKPRAIFFIIAIIIAFSALASCSKKSGAAGEQKSANDYVSYESEITANSYGRSVTDAGGAAFTFAEAPAAELSAEETREEKRIKTGNLSMQTQSFDSVTSDAENLVTGIGGYVESSNLSYSQNGLRRQNYTFRVPSEAFTHLFSSLTTLGSVTSSSSSDQDVSDQYYDTASRLDAKEAEEKRLLELIDQAKELSDLILLEQRLSSVRTDIELYKSRLTGIDRKASYSTIYLYLIETADIYKPGSLWERLRGAFGDSIDGIVAFFQSVLVFIVSAIIPFLIIVVIVLIGWRVYKRAARRRRRHKKSAESSARDAVKSLVEKVGDKSDDNNN